MKLHRAYKFKMEPDFQQTEKLYQFAGCRRFVYNWALDRRKKFYKETEKTISAKQLSTELTILKSAEETLFLKDADSQSLQQALKDVDSAFKNFFAKIARFPKFKSRNKGHFAFRIPQRVKVENGKCYCPKIGWIKIRQSREVIGETKSTTFKRDACGDWFVTITTEFELPDKSTFDAPQKPVGIDAGLKSFVVCSDGLDIPALKIFRNLEKKLARRMRVLSRRKKGSSRRDKARLFVAKVHRKIANTRADFVHKITSDLVAQHDFIGIEDLNVKGMSKNHRLAKSVQDAALGELRRQLEYKSLWNHVRLVKISRWFPSSKMCGNCKAINQNLQLSDRSWLCQECGTFHNRDMNAARNILREALNKAPNLAVGYTDNGNAHGRNVSLATASKSG